MGIAGACRCNEVTYLKVDDVQDKGAYLYVTIPDTKTYVSRSFAVMEEGFSVNAVDLCRRYMSLRPASFGHQGRFFLRYANGKCTSQVVGINTMSRIPAAVASFLQLPDASSYSGHSLRRSSATLLANAGADLVAIKRFGGWKSSKVAEGYIDDSLSSKIKAAKMIQMEASKEEEMQNFGETSCETSIPATIAVNLSSPVKQKETDNIFSFNVNINVNVKKEV